MATRITTTLPDVTQLDVADGNWADAKSRGPIHSIILHTMVGTVAGAAARFNTPGTQVSAHYGVDLQGKLYQWCDEDNVAYHAGNWPVNATSIGIEHEDGTNPQTNPTGYNNPRPDALYEASAKLVADICKFYDFPADKDHIFRHQDVIDKTVYKGGTGCPDALDTDRIISMAAAILNPPAPTSQPSMTPPTPPAPVVEPTVTPQVPSTPTSTPIPSATVTIAPDAVPAVQTPQSESNTVNNTPAQTVQAPIEASSGVSGQAGKVPLSVSDPIIPPFQAKLISFDWLIGLITFLGKLIGIEAKQ